uniref:DUF2188 domain-containing protein n=1 Tax=Candidatus Enterococcus willemsii TaxID=1857215 RepID=UPI00403FBF5E
MAWNMQDYPTSMKNLDVLTRKKAIDIGNALLADKYPEERAIPIAISQAKEWVENATSQERHDFANTKNPSKADSHDSNPEHSRLLDVPVLVKFDAEQKEWLVISEGAKRESDRFHTKKEAVKRGSEIAENKNSTLKVYKMDGTLQEKKNFERD